MAKLIPSYLDKDTVSPGEIDFFKKLSRDPDTENWLVLHSLGIAHHQTRLMGEIDFLVIVPSLGILAVEIKAHSFIRVKDGIWYMGRTDSKGSRRTPFEQVNDSMFSLIKYMSDNNQSLKTLPLFSLVVFTHFDFSTKSVEWDTKDYVGSREYRSKPISKLLTERLRYFLKKAVEKKSGRWLTDLAGRPNKIDMNQLEYLLRPSIEPSPMSLNLSNQIEEELTKYTTEQFVALDTLFTNERVIFDGSAGTGKTFLAIEAALREECQGKRVLFICMNRLLSQMLSDRVGNNSITVITLHKFLLDHAPELEVENNNSFWAERLPEEAYCNLLEQEGRYKKYDTIIIDEAQDIIKNNLWLDCLDIVLNEGLSDGRWLAFGDFSLQTIYNFYSAQTNIKANLTTRTVSSTEGRLTRNCRNTEDSSRLSLSLAGIDSPYQGYLRSLPSIVQSSFLFYKNESSQLKQLNKIIKKALDAGFKGKDIVILSKKSELKSISKVFDKDLKVEPFKFSRKNISYTSIHKFKGLEAPFIILTDFDDLSSEESKKLLFTGASRATDSVHYLFNESTQKSFLELFKKGMENG